MVSSVLPDDDNDTALVFLVGEERVPIETGLKGLWSWTDYDLNQGAFFVPFKDATTAIECLRIVARQIEREG